MKIKCDTVEISKVNGRYHGMDKPQSGGVVSLSNAATLPELIDANMRATPTPRVAAALQKIEVKGLEFNWDDEKLEKEFPAS